MPTTRKCQQCGTRFTIRRTWQLFCKPSCRNRYHEEQRGWCFYCGDPATEREHVRPLSTDPHATETVPACKPCNSFLQDKGVDILHRLDLLIEEHRPLLARQPLWDDEELDELEGRLRQFVRGRVVRSQLLRVRLAHMEAQRTRLARIRNK